MPDSLSWSRHKLLVWKQFPQSDQKTRLCNLCSCRRRSMKREWSNRACNLQAKWFRKTMQPVQTFFYIVLVIYFKKRPQCWMPLLCLVFAEKEFWLRTATDRGLVVWRPVADSGCLTGRGGKKKQNIKGTTCLHGAQKVLMYLWWREGTSPGFVHWKRALYHALSKRTLSQRVHQFFSQEMNNFCKCVWVWFKRWGLKHWSQSQSVSLIGITAVTLLPLSRLSDLFKYRFVDCKLVNSTFLHNKEGCMLDFSDDFNNAYMIYFVNFLGTLAVLPGNIVSALLMDKIGRLRMLGG